MTLLKGNKKTAKPYKDLQFKFRNTKYYKPKNTPIR